MRYILTLILLATSLQASIFKDASSIYVGTNAVKYVYAGTNLAWQSINTDFVSTWRTTVANETITVPTRSGHAYECNVDWGDGSVETISGYDDAKWTHTYADSGDYEVTISGTFETIYFSNSGDKSKLISISNLGSVGWTSFYNSFLGCTSLNSVTGDADTSLVSSMYRMFYYCTSMTTTPNTGELGYISCE